MIFINDNNPPGARGMARYFDYVVTGIITHFGSQAVVFSHTAKNYSPAQHIRPIRFKGSEQIGLHDKLMALALRRIRPQVIYNAWFNSVQTSIPQIVVVYDLIYELFPQYHSRWRVPLRNLDRERQHCFEQTTVLIAISHSTADDLLRVYPQLDPAKIVITHLGVDPFFFERNERFQIVPHKPYFLYVGFRTGHKNFIRLLQAYGQSGLAQKFDLRVISNTNFAPYELECIHQYHLQDNIHLITGATDLQLRQDYASATAFIYPSEYEGFGLPILEAMASGTLVVTSNVSSMPELGGDVAFYFDPYKVETIIAKLSEVACLPAEERNRRIDAGIAQARTFTWERCQQQTVEIIQKLIR